MRRWEDWERSRLRKIKREERRRKELERAFPGGYSADGGTLSATNSMYDRDGSDTVSVASSDEDHWGPQIGAYNEHNPAYPPPPTGVLMPRNEMLATAGTVGAHDLEAMLEVGFDDRPGASRQNLLGGNNAARYQLSDGPTSNPGSRYTPLARAEGEASLAAPMVMSPATPTGPITSGVSNAQTHVRRRSGGGRGAPPAYGPLGPLDPNSRF